jgi:peroxiredoxin
VALRPHERSLVKKFENRPFALLGVNIQAYPVAELKDVMTKEDITWRTFADEKEPADKKTGFYPGRISNAWKLDGTPTLYVIDAKGVIRHHWLGSPGEKTLDEALEKLVKEAEADAKPAK